MACAACALGILAWSQVKLLRGTKGKRYRCISGVYIALGICCRAVCFAPIIDIALGVAEVLFLVRLWEFKALNMRDKIEGIHRGGGEGIDSCVHSLSMFSSVKKKLEDTSYDRIKTTAVGLLCRNVVRDNAKAYIARAGEGRQP